MPPPRDETQLSLDGTMDAPFGTVPASIVGWRKDRPIVDVDAPGLARNDHPDTSREAAMRQIGRSGTARRRVYDAICARPSTDDELQEILRMSGNTERPRRVELERMRLVRDSGLRRPMPGGGHAIVWEAT